MEGDAVIRLIVTTATIALTSLVTDSVGLQILTSLGVV